MQLSGLLSRWVQLGEVCFAKLLLVLRLLKARLVHYRLFGTMLVGQASLQRQEEVLLQPLIT